MSELFFTPSPSNENFCVPQAYYKDAVCHKKPLLAVIFVGQKTVEVSIYTAPDLKQVLTTQEDVKLSTPHVGWYEQDPEEIMSAIYTCCARACKILPLHGYIRLDIEAVSITNQRESTVVWDGRDGKPLYRVIAANDLRAASIADKIISFLPNQDPNYYKSISGLPILPYFLALKIRWLQDNVEDVRKAIKNGYCKVGTLDSWVVWNLTKGALHITDVTNAAHTMLMNIKTLRWDPTLLKTFSITSNMLPHICYSSGGFGLITESSCVLQYKRITGIIADQQAALMGQICLQPGKMNAQFCSDCRLLCNTGKKCVISKDTMTTIAYKLDADSPCVYALEGNVHGFGQLLEWLHTKFRILPDINSTERLARSVRSSNDVFLVPAFNGLHAPYWRKDARGILVGLSDKTTNLHVVRAALEAICFQVYDVIECIRNTGEFRQDVIYAGGPYASNELLMQILADISGVTVVCFNKVNPISYGAAICAGHSIEAVDMHRVKQGIWRKSIDFITYVPFTRIEQRMQQYTKWRHAVARSVDGKLPRKQRILDPIKMKVLFTDSMAGILSITMVLFLINALR